MIQAIEIKFSTRPPQGIYEKARDEFGVDFRKGAVFTVGDVIHCESFPLPDHLYEHEKVHVIQQSNYDGGYVEWWNRYFEDPYFRYTQELEAYRTQYKFFCSKVKDRNQRFKFLNHIATHLTTLYGLQKVGQTQQKSIMDIKK